MDALQYIRPVVIPRSWTSWLFRTATLAAAVYYQVHSRHFVRDAIPFVLENSLIHE